MSINPTTDEIAYIAGNVVVIYDPQQQKQVHFLKNGTGKSILSLQYSPDGKFLAVGEKGKNPCTFIWKLVNRRKPFLITKLTSHRYGIKATAFAEGNGIVMTCGDHDGTVCIWNISHCLAKKDDNSALQELTAPVVTQRVKSEILSCVYMKENQIFVTTGHAHVKSWAVEKLLQSDRRSRLSDIHDSKDVGVSIPVRAAVLGTFRNSLFVDVCCYFDRIYIITTDGHLYSLQMATANNRGRLVVEKALNMRPTGAYGISVNDQYLSIAFADGIIRLINRQTLEYIGALPKPRAFGQESELHSPAPSSPESEPQYPDTIACYLSKEGNLFGAYSDGSFTSWNISEFPKARRNFAEFSHNQCIWDMKLISGNQSNLPSNTLVTCSADNTIRFWDSAMICDPSFNSSSALRGIIHTDDRYLGLRMDSPTSTSGVRCLAISADNKHIASGDRQGNIRIHDLASFSLLDYKEAHDSEVLSLAYAPGDVNLLASASRDRLIHVFDSQKSSYPHVDTLDDHSSSITSVHFASVPSAKGSKVQFVSSSADKSIIFRTIGQPENKEDLHVERFANSVLSGTVYDMCLDTNTHSVLATAKDKKLTRFDLSTGKQIGDSVCASRDSDDIIKLSIHNNGEFALASSTDKCLRMYSCSTERDKENSNRRASTASKCLLVATGSSFITSACFSPCSSRIFGTSAEGMIFVWRVSPMIVQKLTRNLQSPALLSPRLTLGLRKLSKTPSKSKPRQEAKEEEKPTVAPSTWTNTEEIESSLVTEYGLASKAKPDTFGFLSVFSNEDDAKVQALRRLTIEPSAQEEATVADSAALASALLGETEEENFFDFGNFSEIAEPSASSRLSISRAFRQNSSPLPKKPFMTPNHSPIQFTTPLNAEPLAIASPKLDSTPRQKEPVESLKTLEETTQTPASIEDQSFPVESPEINDEQPEAIEEANSPAPPACEEPSIKSLMPNAPEASDTPTTPAFAPLTEEKPIQITEAEPTENENEPSALQELSSLLGAHNQQIAETKQLLETSSIEDDEKCIRTEQQTEQQEEQTEQQEEQTEVDQQTSLGDDVEESDSYDLQIRHQVAMNLLQNAFENAMQLYEDANFEYECIRKEEPPSPYLPVYEQILDNYENVFHTLGHKLSETPAPQPSQSPQLEQFSSMLVHLASLIKDKQIVP